MQDRKWLTKLFITIILAIPTSALCQGNIYRDAIPHIKACVSLIEERENMSPAITGENMDLRDVCPTLTDFLTYEPISEIDPPLENQSSRAYLTSLLVLLESTYQTTTTQAQQQLPRTTPSYPARSEPEQKPFLMAMAQWTFAHVHGLLDRIDDTIQPRTQHSIYIITLNLIGVTIMALLVLYVISYLKKSELYKKHFAVKWQKKTYRKNPDR